MPKNTSVLLIGSNEHHHGRVRAMLAAGGWGVAMAANCAAAEQTLRSSRPDAAIVRSALPDGTAGDLVPRLREIDPELPILVLTESGGVELAVSVLRLGADDFLLEPVDADVLSASLERALAARRARRRTAGYDANKGQHREDPFCGSSAAIRVLAEHAGRVVLADRPALLLGETGCGKGVLARWLHDNGPRKEEPFVALNCAGLKPELLESELFGHAKGSFTGAVAAKQGLLEVAHRGTLFLDEIGDMDLAIQARLLKVLEEKSFRRLGEVAERTADLRLIAATHHDLGQLVKKGCFRSDLYFRINTLKLEIPPLRRRVDDVVPLAETILAALARELGRPGLRLAEATREMLVRYRWPGNIRELRNVLERAALLSERAVIEAADLQFETSLTREIDTIECSLEEIEKVHIERVLAHEGSVAGAARRLGIQRNTLYDKMRKHGLNKPGR